MSVNIPLDGFAPSLKNIIQNSIIQNFIDGGRFGNGLLGGGNERWQISKRAKKQGGKKGKGTLNDKGFLLSDSVASVQVTASGSIAINDDLSATSAGGQFNITLGSKKPYAAIHHYGGTINFPARESSAKWKATGSKKTGYKYKFAKKSSTTKNTIGRRFMIPAHTLTMPRRPIYVLQDEDLEIIAAKFIAYVGERL